MDDGCLLENIMLANWWMWEWMRIKSVTGRESLKELLDEVCCSMRDYHNMSEPGRLAMLGEVVQYARQSFTQISLASLPTCLKDLCIWLDF